MSYLLSDKIIIFYISIIQTGSSQALYVLSHDHFGFVLFLLFFIIYLLLSINIYSDIK